jgi:hypothetical protein
VIELFQEVGSILNNFSNQSLINNYDAPKFPGIHKTRANILGEAMEIKIIPRIAYYA